MVFSMNVFKIKNVGKIKNVKNVKKRALNKKNVKNVFFYIYGYCLPVLLILRHDSSIIL